VRVDRRYTSPYGLASAATDDHPTSPTGRSSEHPAQEAAVAITARTQGSLDGLPYEASGDAVRDIFARLVSSHPVIARTAGYSVGVKQCSRRDCSSRAVREVRWIQPKDAPHAGRTVAVDFCEHHATAMTSKLCEKTGCLRYAEVVIEIDGENIDTRAPQRDQLKLCEPCWSTMKAAPSFSLNGVQMVHDGAGRMKAIPRNIGRG
jgi:hypothetical protein